MNTIEYEIDKVFLNAYYKDLVNEVGEIFELFLQETPLDVHEIKQHFLIGNYKEVAALMHKIAPCFYNVGLPTLTSKIRAIEVSVNEGKIDFAKLEMQHFEEELNNFMPSIVKEHNRLVNIEHVA